MASLEGTSIKLLGAALILMIVFDTVKFVSLATGSLQNQIIHNSI
jgi:hypothetical protein